MELIRQVASISWEESSDIAQEFIQGGASDKYFWESKLFHIVD